MKRLPPQQGAVAEASTADFLFLGQALVPIACVFVKKGRQEQVFSRQSRYQVFSYHPVKFATFLDWANSKIFRLLVGR